jgi:hypothetical protein
LEVSIRRNCATLLSSREYSLELALWQGPVPITIRIEPAGIAYVAGRAVRLGPAPTSSPGALVRTEDGAMIVLLDPREDLGEIPGELNSNGKPYRVRYGEVLAHELGHLSSMTHVADQGKSSTLWSNQSALDAENAFRIGSPILVPRRVNGKIQVYQQAVPLRMFHDR